MFGISFKKKNQIIYKILVKTTSLTLKSFSEINFLSLIYVKNYKKKYWFGHHYLDKRGYTILLSFQKTGRHPIPCRLSR